MTSDTPARDSRAIRDEILARCETSTQAQWIRAAYDAGYTDGRAEEREACARLAEQHDVRYEQRKTCGCGRPRPNGEPCTYEVGPPLPFADLIRARKDTP